MSTVTLEEASANLSELLARLGPSEEVEIVQDGVPLARLIKAARTSWPCQPGSAKDIPMWMSPNFDAPMELRECTE